MRLGLSIVGIVVAAIVLFTGFAMLESWEEVFGPFFAGEQTAPKAPSNEQVEAAIRAYNTALERGEPAAPERSLARQMAVADQSFFRRYGVTQELLLRELEIAEVSVTGPAAYTVETNEVSDLTISRTLSKPRMYRLRGNWQYVLRELDGDLRVVDVKPKEVALEDRKPPPPGGSPPHDGRVPPGDAPTDAPEASP